MRDVGLRPFADAIDTVQRLRHRGSRLALLTNGAALAQREKITRFGLTGLFEAILIEGEVGFGKPDPRIYTLALDMLQVSPFDTWMVGDNLEWDVAQPQRQTIAGIWVDLRGSGVPPDATFALIGSSAGSLISVSSPRCNRRDAPQVSESQYCSMRRRIAASGSRPRPAP